MEHSKKQFLEKLVEKAKTDENLKNALLTNPKELFEKKLKMKLPDNLKITVLEEKSDEIYIVLPAKTNEIKRDLSDEDLSKISGGNFWNADRNPCGGCID